MGIKKSAHHFFETTEMKLLIGAFQITDFTHDWSGSLQFYGRDRGNKVSVSVHPFCCCWSVMDGWMDSSLPSFHRVDSSTLNCMFTLRPSAN